MNRNVVYVDNCWHEVEEVDHPDAEQKVFGPVVGVVRVKDGLILKIRNDGRVEFEQGSPGADERCIPVPGAYVGLREKTAVVRRAGPWTV